jgi:hypothetical protein
MKEVLSLRELEPTIGKILDIAVATIQEHFRKRMAEKYSGIVQEWKNQKYLSLSRKN